MVAKCFQILYTKSICINHKHYRRKETQVHGNHFAMTRSFVLSINKDGIFENDPNMFYSIRPPSLIR